MQRQPRNALAVIGVQLRATCDFTFGDTTDLADNWHMTQCDQARRRDFDLTGFGAGARIVANGLAPPAIRNIFPGTPSDAKDI